MFLQPDPEQEGSWQGLLFDVTARKEAEEQLRASELVHSATVEHLPAIVYREPPERAALQEMYIGPQVEQMLGYTAEEWIAGVPEFWAEHIHPDDVEAVLAANRVANETKTPFGSGLSLPAPRRSLPLGPRRGDVRLRRRRRVVARLHHRHHRAQGGGAAAPRGGGEVPIDRRAGPGGDLPAGVRRRGSERLAHDLHLAAAGRHVRLHLRGGPGRPDPVVPHGPSRRPRPRARRRRREQPRRQRSLQPRVPDDQQGRPHRLGARTRRCSCSSRGARPSGRAS